MRRFLFLHLCLFSFVIVEAKTIDLAAIKRETLDSKSRYYYPSLLERYQTNNSVLSSEEYAHLYYGFSFQESYNPYYQVEYPKEIEQLTEQEENLSRGEIERLIYEARKLFSQYPFDLRVINIMIYANKQKEKNEEADVWYKKLTGIIDAILSSGDGTTPETAIQVIATRDEYNIINRMGLKAKEYRFIEPHYDYIEVEENSFGIAGYYFDVSRLLEEYGRKYRE